jgi:CHC2-type zinc finger protein
MLDIDDLLGRLAKVRQTGERKWSACCPAHEDSTPSLGIRLIDDRLLLHCFAGCETEAVLKAIGLRFSHLYDKPLAHYLPPLKARWSARELLELISREADVVAILAMQVTPGCTLTDIAIDRLLLASSRIAEAQRHVRGA